MLDLYDEMTKGIYLAWFIKAEDLNLEFHLAPDLLIQYINSPRSSHHHCGGFLCHFFFSFMNLLFYSCWLVLTF